MMSIILSSGEWGLSSLNHLLSGYGHFSVWYFVGFLYHGSSVNWIDIENVSITRPSAVIATRLGFGSHAYL